MIAMMIQEKMRQIEAHIAVPQRLNGMSYDKVFCHNLLQDTKKTAAFGNNGVFFRQNGNDDAGGMR